MKSILVIEDDPEIVKLLEIHLSDLPANVITTNDGQQGLFMAISNPPDLIILDIMLPGLNGLEVCRKLKEHQVFSPIIMLTAKSEEIDRILGLEMGADDYITKPFSIRELLARIKAVFRFKRMVVESMVRQESSALKFENLEIDIQKRKVVKSGEKIDLSPKEFELLVLLASNPGRSYSRSELLNLIWGYDFDGYEHTINSTINRLRVKIETDMSKPCYILTKWGVGYMFNEDLN